MMKKIVSVIILIAMLSAVFNVGYAVDRGPDTSAVVLTAETEGGKPGGVLTVTLSVTSNPGFAYMRIVPRYDKSVLTLTGASNEGADLEYDPIDFESGDRNLVILSSKNITGTGNFITVTFAVAEVPSCTTEIEFDIKECYDIDENDVLFVSATVSAQITAMKIIIGAGEGVIDGTVDVNISVANNRGFCMMILVPTFPEFMVLDSITSAVMTGCSYNGNILIEDESDYTSDGVIATMHFIVGEDAACGTYAVTAVLNGLYNYHEDTVCAEVADGSVTVSCDHHKTVTKDAADPTCTAPGSTGDVYCAFCGILLSTSEPIPAKGHSYGEPVFVWAEDYTAASAKFTCSECGDVQTVDAAVTAETTQPGCTEKGEYKYTATASFGGVSYTDVKTVEIPETGHSYGEPVFVWADDYSSATAKFTCSECGDVQTVTAAVTVETTQPSCTEKGEYKYTATAAFGGVSYTDVKTVEIPELSHSYGDPVFVWADDYVTASAKFTCSECGDVQTVAAAVTVETTQPSCTEKGEKKYTAAVLFEGNTYTDIKTVEIPAKDHVYGEPVFVWADDYSSATAKFTCSGCGDVQTVAAAVTVETKQPGCTEKGEYKYTATAAFGGVSYTDVKTVEIPENGHSYGEPVFVWADDYVTASAKFTCSECGDVQTVAAAVTVETKQPTCTEKGENKYTASVSFEGKTYTDVKTVELAETGHSYGEPVFTWADDYSSATAKFTCSGCGDVQTVNATVTVETKEPTYTEKGETKYTASAAFNGRVYTDVKTVEIPALRMNLIIGTGEGVIDGTVDVTISVESNPGFCVIELTPSFPDFMELKKVTSGVLSNCSAGKNIVLENNTDYNKDGVIATMRFTISDKAVRGTYAVSVVVNGVYNYNEDDLEANSFAGSVTITCDHHRTEFRGAAEATCTEPGRTGDKYCLLCGDLLCESETVPAKGHSYGEPVFTWADDYATASAKFTCSECGDVQTVEATVTVRSSEPTCEEKGSVTYTASVTFKDSTYTDEKSFVIPEKGHSYGEPVFVWADDYSSAAAKFTCSACGDVQTVNAAVTHETKQPSCEEKGEEKYTASVLFDGNTYTDVKTVEIPANGHSYGEPVFTWADDHSAAAAKFTCSVCGDVQTVNATVTLETKQPTCTEDGEEKYTATVEFKGKTYTDAETVELKAAGHSYGEPVFTWADDHLTATAKFACSECGDVQTLEATVTSETSVRIEANAFNVTVYTATVEFKGKTYEETAETVNFIYGDVNGDGAVNGKDLIRMRRYLLDPSTEVFPGIDCNGDGVWNGKDLIKLRKYLVSNDASQFGPQ